MQMTSARKLAQSAVDAFKGDPARALGQLVGVVVYGSTLADGAQALAAASEPAPPAPPALDDARRAYVDKWRERPSSIVPEAHTRAIVDDADRFLADPWCTLADALDAVAHAKHACRGRMMLLERRGFEELAEHRFLRDKSVDLARFLPPEEVVE